jgi:hypothetical protein
MFGLYLLILFLNLNFWLTFPQQSKAEKRYFFTNIQTFLNLATKNETFFNPNMINSQKH